VQAVVLAVRKEPIRRDVKLRVEIVGHYREDVRPWGSTTGR
jgi:hypothetical protein